MSKDPSLSLRWVPVPGGTCLFGDAARPRPVPDLWVAATQLTNHQAGFAGEPDLPVTGIDFTTACDLAATVGGRLPSSLEWEWIAAGPDRRTYPWGARAWSAGLARLNGPGSSVAGPAPVGGHPDGATPDGLLDMAGNVWEWTTSSVMGDGRVIRGGSYASKPLYARTTFLNTAPSERRSPGIGLRPVRPA